MKDLKPHMPKKTIKEKYPDHWPRPGTGENPLRLQLRDKSSRTKKETPPPQRAFSLGSYKLPEKNLEPAADVVAAPLAQALNDLAYYLLQQAGYEVPESFGVTGALKKIAKSLVLSGLHPQIRESQKMRLLYDIILEETTKALSKTPKK